MNIAIDISPLKSGHYLQHRVRGTGFYLQNLQASLEKFYPDNKYVYFSKGDLLNEKIDVVHYPYFEPFFLTLPLFSKNKKVVTVHDLTPLVFPEHFKVGLRGRLKWQIQKFALRNTSIITDSRSSKQDIVKYAGIDSARIRIVYLAAGEEFQRIQNSSFGKSKIPRGALRIRIQNLRRKYNLPDKFVLYVGDVTWNKNLPRLIEAIQKDNLALVMVGGALVKTNVDLSNPWNSDFTKVLGLIDGDKRIVRLGFVSKEELVLLYNMATVLAMPSLYEGFGLPILEAMSCGCPVVTSKAGSIPEIASDAVCYVDPHNTDSIAEGVLEVFSNQKLQENLSKKGFARAKKFSWKKTAEETAKVYEAIIK